MGNSERAALLALGFAPLVGCGEPVAPRDYRPQELFTADLRTKDSVGGAEWKNYLRAEALHRAWAPAASSAWRPYYKPTLVCAISIVQEAAQPVYDAASVTADQAETFADSLDLGAAAVFIDLPGEKSVIWAALLGRRGFLPVLTFNNWPHPKGVLRLERALGALLFFARERDEARDKAGPRPAFVLEAGRIVRRQPGADEFDNRFFMAGADLPAADVFKKNGIVQIVYVSAGTAPVLEQDDLNEYFVGLHKAGLKFVYVSVAGNSAPVSAARDPATRATIFGRAEVASYSRDSRSTHNRSYSHYHNYWYGSRGTWGSGGYGGSSGSRSSWGGSG